MNSRPANSVVQASPICRLKALAQRSGCMTWQFSRRTADEQLPVHVDADDRGRKHFAQRVGNQPRPFGRHVGDSRVGGSFGNADAYPTKGQAGTLTQREVEFFPDAPRITAPMPFLIRYILPGAGRLGLWLGKVDKECVTGNAAR